MPAWWSVVVPEDAVEVELPRAARARSETVKDVRALERGALVALRGSAPLSRWRARSFLRAADLRLEREYVVLPRFDGPGYAVEADATSFRQLFANLLFMPAGGTAALVASSLVGRLLSATPLWRVAAALAPSRMLIARRA